MFSRSPLNQNNGDVGGSFRPVLQFTVNWLGAWPEKSGIGPEAELVSVRGPGPGSGSDTGVTRLRPGVPGLMSGSTGGCQLRGHHNTCVQSVYRCRPATELLSSLARRSTCSAWTHLAAGARRGRGNGRVVTLPFISPVCLAPGPFSPHICRLTLCWPTHRSRSRS